MASSHALSAEFERLRAAHRRLLTENDQVRRQPFDRLQHAEHKTRLQAHIRDLGALRRGYESNGRPVLKWPYAKRVILL